MSGVHPADALLLRRAGRTVGLQTAVAVAVVVVTVALLVYVVALRARTTSDLAVVQSAATSADDVGDPPAGVSLLRVSEGRTDLSPGAPEALATLDPRSLPEGSAEKHLGGRSYLLFRSVRADGDTVVAALDLERRGQEQQRLLTALLLGGALGVVGAGVVGGLVGRRAVRPLGAALAVQRRFVADASHELRTPLTVVHTRAQMLAGRLEGGDPDLVRCRTDAARLVADSRVLGDVVDDLLLAAELGHQVSDGEYVDVAALATDLVEGLEAHAAERGVRLLSERPDGPVAVTGVASALRRAFAALVDNALAHTPTGGRVTVTVRREGERVLVEVADTGDGLDPSTLPSLLTPFARGATADEGRRRFGLGLALVAEVVRAHGGTLGVRGAAGAGATFTLDLPAA